MTLRGTHLYIDARGIYVWRRVNPRTGRRTPRSTGCRVLEDALKKVREFEEEHKLESQGVRVRRHSWRQKLSSLANNYFKFLKAEKAQTLSTRRQIRRELRRALRDLGLRTAADLDDVSELHDRLMALDAQGVTRMSLRRSYQLPLKRFTRWLAGNRRHLDWDPLATWEPVRVRRNGEDDDPEVAVFLPDEVARALLALDRLDELHGRASPQRPAVLALLTTAPRIGKLVSRDVDDLDLARRAISYGRGTHRKRTGAGALDPKTTADLEAYVKGRSEGPLFLGPSGGRLTKERFLDTWREAFGLSVVEALWPQGEPWSLELAFHVNRTLVFGVPRINRGGNPKLIREETRARQAELRTRLASLADGLRGRWAVRMERVTVKAFRSTLQTWSEALGVPPSVVDKQLGHTAAVSKNRLETLRAVAGSEVGRKHYLAIDCELLDASRVAVVMRTLLDEAHARLVEEDCRLVTPYVPG